MGRKIPNSYRLGYRNGDISKIPAWALKQLEAESQAPDPKEPKSEEQEIEETEADE